jgi:hypothetical protein
MTSSVVPYALTSSKVIKDKNDRKCRTKTKDECKKIKDCKWDDTKSSGQECRSNNKNQCETYDDDKNKCDATEWCKYDDTNNECNSKFDNNSLQNILTTLEEIETKDLYKNNMINIEQNIILVDALVKQSKMMSDELYDLVINPTPKAYLLNKDRSINDVLLNIVKPTIEAMIQLNIAIELAKRFPPHANVVKQLQTRNNELKSALDPVIKSLTEELQKKKLLK